jgi:hypothetical protein
VSSLLSVGQHWRAEKSGKIGALINHGAEKEGESLKKVSGKLCGKQKRDSESILVE